MGDTLVFRRTRVPAQTLLDYLQDGYDLDGFLEEFPSVSRADAEEFLRLSHGAVRRTVTALPTVAPVLPAASAKFRQMSV